MCLNWGGDGCVEISVPMKGVLISMILIQRNCDSQIYLSRIMKGICTTESVCFKRRLGDEEAGAEWERALLKALNYL